MIAEWLIPFSFEISVKCELEHKRGEFGVLVEFFEEEK